MKKLELIKKKGAEAYPISSGRNISNEELLEDFTSICRSKKKVRLSGRIKAIRSHGGAIFFDLDDGTALFQILFKKDGLSEKSFDFFNQVVDVGDFIECYGAPFLTKRSERSLEAESWRMLSKSLRPLPDKWHGLQDVEERFRRRYLDTLMSPEVKQRFLTRAKVIREIRNYLERNGYLEVETPILQPLAGGASALPFKTHHNALNLDLYLRIAPELYHKELLVGGFPKVYEIGKSFRNEGIDVTHNPEFTEVEWYEAYSEAKKQRALVEDMLRGLVKKIFKKSEISYDGNRIDFAKKFGVISYLDILKRYALMPDAFKMSLEELSLKAAQLGVKTEPTETRQKVMDNIYKKICRPKLVQPTFIVDYPLDYLPLAKRLSDQKGVVDAFQLVVGGIEFVKAFSELNDPLDQAERLKKEESNRAAGDKEAHSLDQDFIEALEYGMPPAGGVGLGVDRLMMLLTDVKNIREVILFPILRPQ